MCDGALRVNGELISDITLTYREVVREVLSREQIDWNEAFHRLEEQIGENWKKLVGHEWLGNFAKTELSQDDSLKFIALLAESENDLITS